MDYQFLQIFLQDLSRATIALFIVVDPLGNIATFISLTENLSNNGRRQAFNVAGIVAFIIAIIFVIGGHQLLNYFGIGMYSFMLAGGLLLVLLAIKIVTGGGWFEVTESREDVGAVPLAFPLLMGPGAMTTVLVFHQTSGVAVTIFSILIVMSVTRVILRFIDSIYRILGKIGSTVISRLMGVFIAAIGVEFIIEGIKHSFP